MVQIRQRECRDIRRCGKRRQAEYREKPCNESEKLQTKQHRKWRKRVQKKRDKR